MLNIAFYSIKCRYALFNDDTLSILYQKHQNNNFIGYNLYLILLFGILVKKQMNITESSIESIYNIIIDILLKGSNIPSHEILFCCLFGLVNISHYIMTTWRYFSQRAIEDKLIDFLLNYNLYSNGNDKNSICLKLSINLLTNLFLSEDINMSEYLLSKNILDFLLNILQKNPSAIIMHEILLTIKNISVGLIDEINQLISHSIFKQCIALLSHYNPILKIEALNIISNCLHYKLYSISIKVYSNDLIDQLINIIDSDSSNSTLILSSLKIILQFLLSDNKENHYFLNAIQEKQIEDLIGKHILSTNKDICIISNAIIKQITFN